MSVTPQEVYQGTTYGLFRGPRVRALSSRERLDESPPVMSGIEQEVRKRIPCGGGLLRVRPQLRILGGPARAHG